MWTRLSLLVHARSLNCKIRPLHWPIFGQKCRTLGDSIAHARKEARWLEYKEGTQERSKKKIITTITTTVKAWMWQQEVCMTRKRCKCGYVGTYWDPMKDGEEAHRKASKHACCLLDYGTQPYLKVCDGAKQTVGRFMDWRRQIEHLVSDCQ